MVAALLISGQDDLNRSHRVPDVWVDMIYGLKTDQAFVKRRALHFDSLSQISVFQADALFMLIWELDELILFTIRADFYFWRGDQCQREAILKYNTSCCA